MLSGLLMCFSAAMAQEETAEPEDGPLPRPTAAPLRVDLQILTPGGRLHTQSIYSGFMPLNRPQYFKQNLSVPMLSPSGRDGAAEMELTLRLFLSESGTALKADARSLLRLTKAPPWWEGAPLNTDILRRTPLLIAGAESQVMEAFRMPRPEGDCAVFVVLTRRSVSSYESAAAALTPSVPSTDSAWKIQILLLRHIGGETYAMEALELRARPGDPAVYLYDNKTPDGKSTERFELKLTPREEEGSVALEAEASGHLLAADERPVMIARRDTLLARDDGTLTLAYGEKNAQGQVVEGVSAAVVLERTPLAISESVRGR